MLVQHLNKYNVLTGCAAAHALQQVLVLDGTAYCIPIPHASYDTLFLSKVQQLTAYSCGRDCRLFYLKSHLREHRKVKNHSAQPRKRSSRK